MYHIVSSSIDSIGYEPWAQELFVRFQGNETTYVYHGIKLETYESLLSADSLGGFINKEIKPRYSVTQLGE